MWCYSRIFFRRGFLYIYSHYVNPLLTWPLKRLRLHDWQQKPHVPGSRLLSDCGTDVMADCSKKRGEHYISCVDWQRGPPRYLTMLTQDVRIGDKAVHRDKEMRKIEKCCRSVRWTIWETKKSGTILHHFSWLAYGQRTRKIYFFHFQNFLTLADILS